MPATIGLNQNFCRLPRQKSFVSPESPTDPSKTLRRSGTSLELLPHHRDSQNIKIVRHKTLDYEVWGIVTSSGPPGRSEAPENSPESLSRPDSGGPLSERLERHKKFPVLGPTRQETERYFKKKRSVSCRTLQGLSLRGPNSDAEDKNLSLGGGFRDQDDGRQGGVPSGDSQSRLKAQINSLTTHSVAVNRQRISSNENPLQYHDVRFFAELVKPLQYRLQRKKDRVIIPSKHGFHPRSQSPTFKRLVEATEKLQIISDRESLQMLERNKTDSDASMATQSFHSPRRVMSSVNHVFEPYSVVNDGDSNTPRNIYINIANINTKSGLEIPGEYPPKHTIAEEDGDVFEDDTDLESNRSESYFKVDFKVEESHASLKLFLPHINGQKDKTDDESVENDNKPPDSQVKFPPLIQSSADSSQSRTYSGIRKAYRRSLPPSKRKRRKIERCPSASDSDKRVKDHLNDVPTLVSLDKEGCKSLLHSKDTLCSFENCPYHSK